MKNVLERLTIAADLPEEPIPGQPLIELVGDGRVLIEHHKGVMQYGRCQIGVRVKFGTVLVFGEKLELTKMTAGTLVITGRIQGVRLERRG